MKTQQFLMIVLLTLLGLSLISGWKTYHQAKQYQLTSQQLAQQSTPGQLSWDAIKHLFGGITDVEQQQQAQQAHQQAYQLHSALFFIFILASVFIAWLLFKFTNPFFMLLLGIAVVTFIIGILAPAMALTASQPITGLGNVIVYQQTKGIYSTIEGLIFHHQNFLVGIPLALFSLVIPFIKNIAMFAVLLNRHQLSQRAMNVIHKISKWSMADVFVVSLLLAFFAAEKDQLMQAELLPGTYFFALYAVLSIVLSHHIHQLDHHAKETSNMA